MRKPFLGRLNTNCRVCDGVISDNCESWNKQFCSTKCSGVSRRKTTTKVCIICSNEYAVPRWLGKIKKTCSKKCGYKFLQSSALQRRSRQCLVCGKEFIKKHHSVGIYCSRMCYWSHRPHTQKSRCLDCQARLSVRPSVKTVKRCRDCANKFRQGAGHHGWITDRSKLSRVVNYGERRSYMYSNWRKQVWLRDNFKCKIANPDCSGRIEAHHILGWTAYPELRYQLNNGITLCHAHHPRKRAEEKRLTPYFQGLVPVSKESSSA